MESLAYNALLPLQEAAGWGNKIPLPEVFERLGSVLHLSKRQSWLYLLSMKQLGWLEYTRFRWIRLCGIAAKPLPASGNLGSRPRR